MIDQAKTQQGIKKLYVLNFLQLANHQTGFSYGFDVTRGIGIFQLSR